MRPFKYLAAVPAQQALYATAKHEPRVPIWPTAPAITFIQENIQKNSHEAYVRQEGQTRRPIISQTREWKACPFAPISIDWDQLSYVASYHWLANKYGRERTRRYKSGRMCQSQLAILDLRHHHCWGCKQPCCLRSEAATRTRRDHMRKLPAFGFGGSRFRLLSGEGEWGFLFYFLGAAANRVFRIRRWTK